MSERESRLTRKGRGGVRAILDADRLIRGAVGWRAPGWNGEVQLPDDWFEPVSTEPEGNDARSTPESGAEAEERAADDGGGATLGVAANGDLLVDGGGLSPDAVASVGDTAGWTTSRRPGGWRPSIRARPQADDTA